MRILEDEGKIHTVAAPSLPLQQGDLPCEGIGPCLAADTLLAFQYLVGGHSEERVQMEQRRGKLRRRKRHQGRVSGQIGLNFSYAINDTFAVDLGYRFLMMGDGLMPSA